jgi:hypothetical protein
MRVLHLVGDGLNSGGKQRPVMGDFERATGHPAFTQARAFSRWSDLKQNVFDARGSLYLGYVLVACVALIALVWRTPFRTAGICLTAMTMIALLTATLGDALEVTRHCFLFNVLTDFVFVSCVACVLGRYWAADSANGISSTAVARTGFPSRSNG